MRGAGLTEGRDGEGRELFSAESWHNHMDEVRANAAELAADGVVRIAQGDNEVDIATVRGPIRIRRGPQWDARGQY